MRRLGRALGFGSSSSSSRAPEHDAEQRNPRQESPAASPHPQLGGLPARPQLHPALAAVQRDINSNIRNITLPSLQKSCVDSEGIPDLHDAHEIATKGVTLATQRLRGESQSSPDGLYNMATNAERAVDQYYNARPGVQRPSAQPGYASRLAPRRGQESPAASPHPQLGGLPARPQLPPALAAVQRDINSNIRNITLPSLQKSCVDSEGIPDLQDAHEIATKGVTLATQRLRGESQSSPDGLYNMAANAERAVDQYYNARPGVQRPSAQPGYASRLAPPRASVEYSGAKCYVRPEILAKAVNIACNFETNIQPMGVKEGDALSVVNLLHKIKEDVPVHPDVVRAVRANCNDAIELNNALLGCVEHADS